MADNLEIPSKCNEDDGVIVRIIATNQLCTVVIGRVVTILPSVILLYFSIYGLPMQSEGAVRYVVEANKMS